MTRELQPSLPVEDCPGSVVVTPDPNSYAMRYLKKWRGYSVTTHEDINCLVLDRKVGLLVSSNTEGGLRLLCQELISGRCNFVAP